MTSNLDLLANAAADAAPSPSTSSSHQPSASAGPSSPSAPLTSPNEAQETSTAKSESDVPPAKRVVDENTPLDTLTEEEIRELTEKVMNEGANEGNEDRPLVSTPVPISVIKDEYTGGSSDVVIKKIAWLERNGWDMVWRAKGDGDCFYRSFALAFYLRILHSSDPLTEANLAFSSVEAAKGYTSNFDSETTADFYDAFILNIQRMADQTKPPFTEYELVQDMQVFERSQSIIVFLRLLTSGYIQANPDTFAPFLMNPETFQPLSVQEFVTAEVIPLGKHADQMMIQALSKSLKQGIRVCYLDGSDVKGDADGEVNWVDFETEEGAGLGESPLVMLYRPGHYDVLAKDTPPDQSGFRG